MLEKKEKNVSCKIFLFIGRENDTMGFYSVFMNTYFFLESWNEMQKNFYEDMIPENQHVNFHPDLEARSYYLSDVFFISFSRSSLSKKFWTF